MTRKDDEQRGIEWGTARLHALAADKGMNLSIKWHPNVDRGEYAIRVTVEGVTHPTTMKADDLADCGRGDEIQRASAEIKFVFTVDALHRRLSSPAGRN